MDSILDMFKQDESSFFQMFKFSNPNSFSYNSLIQQPICSYCFTWIISKSVKKAMLRKKRSVWCEKIEVYCITLCI